MLRSTCPVVNTYNKPNNIPLYVNKKSNHPPRIISNIPQTFQRLAHVKISVSWIFAVAYISYGSGFSIKFIFRQMFKHGSLV